MYNLFSSSRLNLTMFIKSVLTYTFKKMWRYQNATIKFRKRPKMAKIVTTHLNE